MTLPNGGTLNFVAGRSRIERAVPSGDIEPFDGTLRVIDSIDVTQAMCVIHQKARCADFFPMNGTQVPDVSNAQDVATSDWLMGWGALSTTCSCHLTAHAVVADQTDNCTAVCGTPLVVVSLSRPWSGQGLIGTDRCRLCTEMADDYAPDAG